MRRARFLTFALILPLVFVAPRMHVSATRSHKTPSNYAPGEVIVKLKAAARQLQPVDQHERLMAIASLAGDQADASSQPWAEQLVGSTPNNRVGQIIFQRGLDRIFVLKVDPNTDIDSIVSQLRLQDEVEYAEPNYLVKFGSVVPDDPGFSQQWALLNLGVYVDDFPATPNADIKADQAWDITTGSPDVIVAVTDTGIDLTHPDLVRNIYTNPKEIAGNGIDDDHNGFIDDVHGFNVADQNGDVSDAVGHGTFMAGLIAAEMNNGIGITGVCQSKVMPVRFYKRYGPDPVQYSATVADAARALVYSIAAGASIINASWTTLLNPGEVPEDVALALQDAVKATDDAGALLVCIAGNDGYDLDYSSVYPASYGLPNQIVVAASDYNDEIWHPFFNPFIIKTGFGPNTVHLAAPGVSVLTTQAHGDCFLCTQDSNPDNWYARQDGSSISAALVSGVAALLKSKYPNDSGVLLKRRILQGVEVRSALGAYVITSGRLSAVGALNAQVSVTPPELDNLTYKAKNGKLLVYGSGMQQGVKVVVGNSAYSAKPRSDDGTAFLAIVPKTAFPSGTPVGIKLRNPDGGQSQALTITR
jgi:subtilisin family serine protease